MRHARQHAVTHVQTLTRERRQRLAIEAARLMSEDGIRDFHQAKLKAAQRLGILDDLSLPRNCEIEQALRDYQRLFCADSQPALLRVRREAAARAMHFFAQFTPRLVGSVLDGTADAHSPVCMHLHTDQPDGVGEFLREQGIPAETGSRHLWIDREREAEVPVWLFSAEDLSFDLTVLPHDALRQAPLDRSGNRPMRRASRVALRAMLEPESRKLDVLDPHRRQA